MLRNTAHRRLMWSTTAFSILVCVANADIIGVDLSGENKDGHKPSDENEVVGLLDSVHTLNRYTFEKTILDEHADDVAHWIVLFCPPWFEPCQALEPTYRHLSEKWQSQLNNALLSTEVRFASVDCATEKALCNSQNVVTYPFVAHYRQHKQVKVWRGKSFDEDEKRLTDFLQRELGSHAITAPATVDSEDVTSQSSQKIPVDFLLIFAAIAGNAWFISRGGFGTEASSRMDTCTKQPAAGPASHSSAQAVQSASCVARSLPKEWGHDRPSLEL